MYVDRHGMHPDTSLPPIHEAGQKENMQVSAKNSQQPASVCKTVIIQNQIAHTFQE